MSEANKAVVTRWFEEVWSGGKLDQIESLLDPQCVGHGLEKKDGCEIEGAEEHRRFIGQLRQAIPDLGFGMDDLIAEGDRVSVRLTMRGTHVGDELGVPASHAGILVAGLALFKVSEGKICVAWYGLNWLNFYQQLGAAEVDSRLGLA